LDFLGFSHQNLAFSIGYAGFSLKEKSCALLPHGGSGEAGDGVLGGEKHRIVHGDGFNYISDFLQSIAIRAVPFCRLNPKQLAPTNIVLGTRFRR
jgi:hypothetical protein